MDQQFSPTPEKPALLTKTSSKDISIWEALGIAWDLLATVLVLTTVFALAGILADRYFHTKFLFTIIGFVLLIVIGRPVLLRKAKIITARLEGRQKPTQHP